MDYFLDSNVLIGYIFQLDIFNELSNKILNKCNECLISPRIKTETNKIFQTKNREYEKFFLKLISVISKYCKDSFISNERIHRMINEINQIGKLKRNEMHYIIEKIWKYFNLSENQDCINLICILEDFLDEFDSSQYILRNNIFKKLNEIPKHTRKDERIVKLIRKNRLKKILHKNDEEILFDLNEYANEHPQLDLCLVSWDDDFIKAVKILIDELSFKKYIGRHESKTNI